jgi:eukaryotic-like serine/threonine-protein kinase
MVASRIVRGSSPEAELTGSRPSRQPEAIELDTRGIELRMTKSAVRARLFGGEPERPRLGRFVVLERIGSGAMGVVYAAYDPQLDRKVALKVLRHEAEPDLRERHRRRLLREARAMARLSHVNVMTVFEVGVLSDRVFLAMEFVSAPTLRQVMDRPREKGPDDLLRVFAEAGHGLAAAHAEGLVHRDFKPENVLVPQDGPVRVTDFGLARPITESVRSARPFVAPRRLEHDATTVAFAGTPAYMAPEQLRGEVVDARADQFAFCVALYEALTTERPFTAEHVARMALGEDPPPPPPPRVSVPRALVDAVMKGLAIDAEARHPDMQPLLTALASPTHRRAHWVGGAVLVGSLSLLSLWALVGRHENICPYSRDTLAGAWDEAVRDDVARAFARTGLGYALDTRERVEVQLDAYVDDWLEARRATCLATHRGEQSTDLLDRRMGCLDRRLAGLRAFTRLLRDADDDVVHNAVKAALELPGVDVCTNVESLLAAPTVPTAMEEEVRTLRGELDTATMMRRTGRWSEALDVLEPLASRTRELGHPPLVAEALLERARLDLRRAEASSARTLLEQVLEITGDKTTAGIAAEAAVELLDVLIDGTAENELALEMTRVARVAVRVTGDDPLLSGRIELARARALFRVGHFEDGVAAANRGVDALAEAGRRAQPERALALRILCALAHARGELEQAKTFGKQALALATEVLGEQHPDVAGIRVNLGAVALAQQDYELARAYLEEAAHTIEAAVGSHHPVYATALGNLGYVAREDGDLEAAREHWTRALALVRERVGDSDARVGSMLINLGAVLADLGEHDEAEAKYEEALELQQRVLLPRHPEIAVTLANMGRLAQERGRFDQAETLLERSYEIRREALGATHELTIRMRLELADLAEERGHQVVAARHFERALDALLERDEPSTGALFTARFGLARTSVSRNHKHACALALEALDSRPEHEDLASLERWREAHRCR